MNIEIITCINTKLKETGFGSLLACNDVMAVVQSLGHTVLVTQCRSLNDLKAVVDRDPDLVILAVKYLPVTGGEDVWFSKYFAQNDITFSGSTRETLNYDSDKEQAKAHLASQGIKTARYFTATPGEYKTESDLPFTFPLFIKPTDAANGNGIDNQSFVENFADFADKIESLYEVYRQPALVEEYLGGREFTVAVIKSANGVTCISAIEIVPPVSTGTLRILGAKVKSGDTEILQSISSNDSCSVKDIAELSFKGLGVRGYARIDVKMDAAGTCYFMEANLVPGMNRGSSYFPRACEIANKMTYDRTIELMLDESFERVRNKQKFYSNLEIQTLENTA